MLVVIPYIDYQGAELRYCLRGIEKFVEDPEVIIVGDKPTWIKNVHHLHYRDNMKLEFKERNIFEKIMLVKDDFLFFNDDHFLLKPFSKHTYHYSGKISQRIAAYDSGNYFRKALENTYSEFGDIDNYFRHGPIFCRHEIMEMVALLDWTKPWGYCCKSIYCHVAGIKGTEYPDLKIRHAMSYHEIRSVTHDREYFSTGNYSVNGNMIAFLQETYPDKSKFEK